MKNKGLNILIILILAGIILCKPDGSCGKKDENPIAPSVPPGAASTFSAVCVDSGAIKLTWVNPTDSDYFGMQIVWKTNGFPTSISDGDTTLVQNKNEYIHTGLADGTMYYYTIFAKDTSGNYSSGITVSHRTWTALSITLLKDSYIRSDLPGNFYGASNSLQVSFSVSTSTQRILVEFNYADLAGLTIGKGMLYLNLSGTAGAPSGTVDLALCQITNAVGFGNDWMENWVTWISDGGYPWASGGTLATEIITKKSIGATDSGIIGFPIDKKYILVWQALGISWADYYWGFCVKLDSEAASGSDSQLLFDSKESGSIIPRLVIYYEQ